METCNVTGEIGNLTKHREIEQALKVTRSGFILPHGEAERLNGHGCDVTADCA
jgi:hypothetical protein